MLYLVALGANLGINVTANALAVADAARRLARMTSGDARISRLYRTPAWPPGSGPDFVNAAMALQSIAAPGAMMERLHRLERRAGRTRGRRWAARSLDLDLLAAGERVLPDPAGHLAWRALTPEEQLRSSPERLVLPHPRLQDRGFVLVPLAEIAPLWRHPLTGRRVIDMVRDLSAEARASVRPIRRPGGVVKRHDRA